MLDESVLLARSTIAGEIAGRFRAVRETAQRSYDADARALDTDEREFAARGLQGAGAATRRLDLAARRDTLRRRGDQINRDLADLDKELTASVVRLALPTIRRVAARSGCTMVVSRASLVDLADPSLDISAPVVELLNAARTPTAPTGR